MGKRWTEAPPTAGLPLALRELLPGAATDFATVAARFLGVDVAGLACSGTASLVLALSAMRQLSPRRSVVVPAYTCPLVVHAVRHCGLRVQLCDLAPDDFALEAEDLAQACGPDTLAIVATHLAGRVADLAPVLAVARACGAFVIEDAAQAFGARCKVDGAMQSVGLQGDVGFFSFAVGKGLTLFEGGLWVARNAALRETMTQLSASVLPHDFGMELRRSLGLAAYALCYRPSLLPWVYGAPLRRALRRGEVAEAVGDVFYPHIPLHTVGRWRQSVGARALAALPDFLRATQAQALRRLAQLDAVAGLHVLRDAPGGIGTWPSLQVLLPDEARRDAALARLWTARLGVTRLFAHALTDYAYLRPQLADAMRPTPRARDFAARSLSISNSLWLDDASFERVLAVLAESVRG